MRHVATPGELRAWGKQLAVLPPDRIAPVKQMLCEVVADCPACEESVRRCDSRRLVEERLYHRPCAPIPLRSGRSAS